MVLSSCSLTWTSPSLSHKLNWPLSNRLLRSTPTSSSNNVSCSMETSSSSDKIPDRYRAFVDPSDGCSYVYPSDWRI
ncbi:unnamed protein product [Lathyrus sativus]|nr:unnamed protein product [Lathyrus sativus]